MKIKSIWFFILVGCLGTSAPLFGQDYTLTLRKLAIVNDSAKALLDVASAQLDAVKMKRIKVEEDVLFAKENPSLTSKEEAKKLEKRLKDAKNEEKMALKKRTDAADYAAKANAAYSDTHKNRVKFVKDFEEKYGVIQLSAPVTDDISEVLKPAQAYNNPANPTDAPTETPIPATEQPTEAPATTEAPKNTDADKKKSKEKRNNKPAATPSVVYRPYNSAEDVAVNPPVEGCLVTFDGVDNFTGKKKKEIGTQPFFSHTEDFMRAALKEKEYITCDISASRVQGGFTFLTLTFTIQSRDAQRSFGFLDKSTPISFKFVNGRTINLANTKTDIGTVDVEKNTTTYRAQLQLFSTEVKTLSESELDLVRVAWSAGYEDYDVYNTDMLINILKCLDK